MSIGRLQVTFGDPVGALETSRSVRQRGYPWRQLIERIAQRQASAGDLDGARETLRRIRHHPLELTLDDRDPREIARHRIQTAYAIAMAERGDATAALSAMEQVPWRNSHVEVEVALARFYAREGSEDLRDKHLGIAGKFASQAESEPSVMRGMHLVIDAALEEDAAKAYKQLIRDLRDLASRLENKSLARAAQRKIILLDIARDYREKGGTLHSRAADYGAEFLHNTGSIAMALADEGLIEEAVELARAMPDKDGASRENVLLTIALRQAEAGDYKGASDTFTCDPPTRSRPQDIDQVVRIHLAGGRLESAQRAAALMRNVNLKGRAYLSIARARHEAGQMSAARTMVLSLERIKSDPAGIHGPPGAAGVFDINHPSTWAVDIYGGYGGTMSARAQHIEERGDLAATALRFHLTAGIPAEPDFSGAFRDLPPIVLRRIGQSYARWGNVDQALDWGRGLPKPRQRAWSLVGIAEGLSE